MGYPREAVVAHKLAIDFGTTNSILARWNDAFGQAEILALPGLSAAHEGDRRPWIPFLLYVEDGRAGQMVIG